jgi:Uma2 family endonuclease
MGMPTIALPLPRYTVADLDQLPDDGSRYELLEGWLIVTPFPSSRHQGLVARIFRVLDGHLAPGTAGHVYAGGCVQRALNTRLLPDLLVVSPQGRPGVSWSAMTERWLVVEVLSPSTRVYDRSYKVNAYLAMGVREVWLVDPRERAVDVHRAVGAPPTRVTDVLRWQAPGAAAPLAIELAALFADAD